MLFIYSKICIYQWKYLQYVNRDQIHMFSQFSLFCVFCKSPGIFHDKCIPVCYVFRGNRQRWLVLFSAVRDSFVANFLL